jgi:FSR family fosmidomycin resistance protein-like MFS transporter
LGGGRARGCAARCHHPSRDLLVRAAAPPGSSGKVFGFVYSGLDLGATIAPAIAGRLLDAGVPAGLFWLASVATALSIVAAVSVRPLRTSGMAVGRVQATS